MSPRSASSETVALNLSEKFRALSFSYPFNRVGYTLERCTDLPDTFTVQ